MTKPVQEFTNARLKVQRAKHHIHKLIDEYSVLLNADLAKLVIESDVHTGYQRVKIVNPPEFPPAIPLMVGDAVHNLRTAFDYIVVAITGETGLGLPIGKTRDDVINKSTHYEFIKKRWPKLAAFILDDIQPYHRGKFLLWELSELDRIDKHRLILSTYGETHRIGVELEDESGKLFTMQWFTVADSYSSTQTYPTKGPLKINNQGQSTISVLFGPGTPLKDQPVLETLDNFSELAFKAIEAFEHFYFGKID